MFEPGDRVAIIDCSDLPNDKNETQIWTVLQYPWKQWHDQMTTIGDSDGNELVVNVKNLRKVDVGSLNSFSGGCGADGCCGFEEEEMRL